MIETAERLSWSLGVNVKLDKPDARDEGVATLGPRMVRWFDGSLETAESSLGVSVKSSSITVKCPSRRRTLPSCTKGGGAVGAKMEIVSHMRTWTCGRGGV